MFIVELLPTFLICLCFFLLCKAQRSQTELIKLLVRNQDHIQKDIRSVQNRMTTFDSRLLSVEAKTKNEPDTNH